MSDLMLSCYPPGSWNKNASSPKARFSQRRCAVTNGKSTDYIHAVGARSVSAGTASWYVNLDTDAPEHAS